MRLSGAGADKQYFWWVSDIPGETAPGASDGIGERSRRRILTYLWPLTPLEGYEILEPYIPPECPSPSRRETPTGLDYDYEAVFLAHAKLYILSYSQGIYALSDVCLRGLLKMKIFSRRNEKRILENLFELVRYVYCCPRDVIVPPEPLQPAWAKLQGILSQTCAMNINAMGENREFKLLLQEGGALATDVMAKTVWRLGSAEASLAKAGEEAASLKVALAMANQAAATAEAALAEATRQTTAGTGYEVDLLTGGSGASPVVYEGAPAAGNARPNESPLLAPAEPYYP